MRFSNARRMTALTAVAAAIVLVTIVPSVVADGLTDFQLAQAIPADAVLAVHARDHAGKDFVNGQWERLWGEIEKVHIERDIKRSLKKLMVSPQAEEAEVEAFEAHWQQMSDLATSVEWSMLGKRESAFCMKLGFPTPEFVMLLMPPEGKVGESFEGLAGVAKKLVGLAPEGMLQLTTEETEGLTAHRISFTQSPFPIVLTLAHYKNVIVVGFGSALTEQSLMLLQTTGGPTPLAKSERFQAAMGKLPAPTDGFAFFDVARFMGQLRGVVDGAIAMAEPQAPAEGEPGYEDYQMGKALPAKIFDRLDIFEYSASVMNTDDKVSRTHSITLLKDDAQSKLLYKVLYANGPADKPLRHVPDDVGEFFVLSGFDLHALYTGIIELLKNDIPNGGDAVAFIDALKEDPNNAIDIEKELIGWIGGRVSYFSIPGPSQYSPAEMVLMLSTKDEDQARKTISRILDVAKPQMAEMNGQIVDVDIDGTEGFKSIVVPQLMMVAGKPVIGVHEGFLIVGSSVEAITGALATAKGEAGSFADNTRFREEGVKPQGDVYSLSFADLTTLGEDLSRQLAMLPMLQMVPEIGGNPLAQGLLGIAGKMARVVRKLDFFQSKASMSAMEGQLIRSETRVTYREPPVTKPKEAAAQPETEAGETEADESDDGDDM